MAQRASASARFVPTSALHPHGRCRFRVKGDGHYGRASGDGAQQSRGAIQGSSSVPSGTLQLVAWSRRRGSAFRAEQQRAAPHRSGAASRPRQEPTELLPEPHDFEGSISFREVLLRYHQPAPHGVDLKDGLSERGPAGAAVPDVATRGEQPVTEIDDLVKLEPEIVNRVEHCLPGSEEAAVAAIHREDREERSLRWRVRVRCRGQTRGREGRNPFDLRPHIPGA